MATHHNMTKPAEPERKDKNVGTSNPAESLWEVDKPYTGPPEEGQPRKGSAQQAPATAPQIVGDTEGRK